LPSVILSAVNHDDPRYKEIPQWQKDMFWIVIPSRMDKQTWDAMTPQQKSAEMGWFGGSIYRIPKPFEMGILFGTVPERITNWILNQDPKAFDGIFSSLWRGFSPGVIPTAVNPGLENWAGKSTFFDRPIVPRSKEDILPQYQYGPYTSETAKALGNIIGKLPLIGDTGAASPANIENLIRGWTGGLGKYALDIADAGLKAAGIVEGKGEEPTKHLADYPFFKGFVVRYPSANTESIQQFYDAHGKAQKVQKTVHFLGKEEGDVEGAIKLYQERGGAQLDGIATSLKNMRKLTEMITKNPTMTGDEKREQLDIIYLQMTQIAATGVQIMDTLKVQKEEMRQSQPIIPKKEIPSVPSFNQRIPEQRPQGGAPTFQ
jgi:hypothetical protein